MRAVMVLGARAARAVEVEAIIVPVLVGAHPVACEPVGHVLLRRGPVRVVGIGPALFAPRGEDRGLYGVRDVVEVDHVRLGAGAGAVAHLVPTHGVVGWG